MRINSSNILYAACHPVRTFRYLRNRDRIAYSDIAKFLPRDPVIIEAGAHDGTNTAEMAEFWPHATIHAFEPVPAAAEQVALRVSGFNARVQCHPIALGPVSGEIEMHLSGDGSSGACQSSSMLRPTDAQLREFPDIKFGITRSVAVTTLDDWAEQHNVTRVDFLWLDMQGYEMRALEGAIRTLDKIAAIHMEVSNIRLYEAAPLYPVVKERMWQLGFAPEIEATFRIGGNVLFVRRK